MKNYKHEAGHMIKMAAMLIYSKNPSNFLLWYGWPDLNETWYVAFGTPAYHSVNK